MNVRKIDGIHGNPGELNKRTDEQLQNEYDYILAQKMLESILEKGLITNDEFNKITELNRQYFSPFLVEIMPNNT